MRSIFAVCFVLVPLSACAAERDWFPLQGDVTFGRRVGKMGPGTGSIYVGSATALDGGLSPRFVGAGTELTLEERGPYEWSIGGGPRFGWLFAERARTQLGPLPDAYVYSRVTPFVAQGGPTAGTGGGVRVGVGVSSLEWSRFWLTEPLDLSSAGIGICIAIPAVWALRLFLTVVNHGELTYEWYVAREMTPQHRLGWRLGMSF